MLNFPGVKEILHHTAPCKTYSFFSIHIVDNCANLVANGNWLNISNLINIYHDKQEKQ